MLGVANLGEHGGEVVRTLKLFGEELKPQTVVPGKKLLEVPARNRRALRDSGFMKFFDAPSKNTKPKTSTKSVKPKKGMKILFNGKTGLVTRTSPTKKLMWVKVGTETHKTELKNVKEVADG